MFAELSSDQSFALVFLFIAAVGALAFLVVVAVDSALSSPTFRRLRAWLKRRPSTHVPELSDQFRTVAEWKPRPNKLNRKRE